MVDDVRDANDARERSEHSAVDLCACGAYTVSKPCSKCRREALKNGEPKPP